MRGTALSTVCWVLLQHTGVAPGLSPFTDDMIQTQRTEVPEQAKEWEPRMDPNRPTPAPHAASPQVRSPRPPAYFLQAEKLRPWPEVTWPGRQPGLERHVSPPPFRHCPFSPEARHGPLWSTDVTEVTRVTSDRSQKHGPPCALPPPRAHGNPCSEAAWLGDPHGTRAVGSLLRPWACLS